MKKIVWGFFLLLFLSAAPAFPSHAECETKQTVETEAGQAASYEEEETVEAGQTASYEEEETVEAGQASSYEEMEEGSLSENAIKDSLLQKFDFTEENEVVTKYFPQLDMTMEQMLEEILSGGFWMSPAELVSFLLQHLKAEAGAVKTLFFMVCFCGVLSALAQNLTGICDNKQSLQLGFYMIYLVLCVYLLEAFTGCMSLARESLQSITGFLNVFLPTYYFSVGISVGPASGMGFYRISMMAVYFVEYIFYLFLLPLVSAYFLLSMASLASRGDRMASLLTLIRKIINLTMKGSMAFIGGLSAIRMLILPATDQISYGSAQKLLSMIPGIGAVNDVTLQMIGGSLILIKNGIGVVIMLLLVMLAVVPLLRLLVIALAIRLGAAFAFLTAGDSLSRLAERTSSAIMLLLKVTGSAFTLNLLVLGMVAACH